MPENPRHRADIGVATKMEKVPVPVPKPIIDEVVAQLPLNRRSRDVSESTTFTDTSPTELGRPSKTKVLDKGDRPEDCTDGHSDNLHQSARAAPKHRLSTVLPGGAGNENDDSIGGAKDGTSDMSSMQTVPMNKNVQGDVSQR